jgi:hypothetical protein
MGQLKAWTCALAIGGLVTLITAVIAAAASSFGHDTLAALIYWPNAVLQSSVACVAVAGRCEGSPANVAAYFASFVLGVVVYGLLCYLTYSRRRGTF